MLPLGRSDFSVTLLLLLPFGMLPSNGLLSTSSMTGGRPAFFTLLSSFYKQSSTRCSDTSFSWLSSQQSYIKRYEQERHVSHTEIFHYVVLQLTACFYCTLIFFASALAFFFTELPSPSLLRIELELFSRLEFGVVPALLALLDFPLFGVFSLLTSVRLLAWKPQQSDRFAHTCTTNKTWLFNNGCNLQEVHSKPLNIWMIIMA